ncbi:putative phosphoesterase [Delftia phage PhiW-14]|uniref:Putative phosphoesterase n=1 Tax=Delftia phage PhiW-14 TaxID=665032 RepID=C9DGI6_BPW14|nr:phosphoesterase [Delftia phage PhiW-14]ACV50237.1 putative phosphoesterase [Delftia phage PhiW-14]
MHSVLDLSHFSKIWFTSDLHVGHNKMKEFGNLAFRPGETQEEMDQHLLDTINNTCGPNDLLFVTGDVSFLSKEKTNTWLNKVATNMALAIGNHDWDLMRHDASFVRRFVITADNLIQKMPDGDTVFLSHFPHLAWPNMKNGWYHFHGHLHGEPYTHPGRIRDVGWDVWGRPVSWEELKEDLKGRITVNHHKRIV